MPYDPVGTIEEAKLQIHEKSGIPDRLQSLIFARKQLEDDRTLADYCIQYLSTFHIILREEETSTRQKN